MAITAPPNCAVQNRDENRAQNTWRTPESGVSLSHFYWRTRTIHQNAGVSRRKLTKAHLRRAHLSCHLLVGTLRFADPTQLRSAN